MRYPRRVRLLAAVVALVSLLFTHIALAAYDCPQLAQPLQQPALHGPAAQGGSCCSPHDEQSPNLCQAHGQVKSQSMDTPAQPPVAPFVPAGFVLSVTSVDTALPCNFEAPAAFLQCAGSSPPISIRHCCLRN